MFKIHKMEEATFEQTVENESQLLPCRGVQPTVDYATSSLAKFEHCQLVDKVNKHKNILVNSRQLVALLDNMEVTTDTYLFGADVTALYPSIRIDKCLKALEWFMTTYMPRLPILTKNFLLRIAKIILDNSYVEFEGKIYKQILGIGTGTISSGDFGNIYLLYCDKDVVPYFAEIQLYKRYLDDVMGVWKGA
jgi:hypothetical protein